MLEAGEVVLADRRQVVAVQIAETNSREEEVREQEAKTGHITAQFTGFDD